MVSVETRRAPLWLRIVLIAVSLVAGGLLIWLMLTSLRQGARSDEQRVRELAIAADNLATWPEVARQIGRSNLFHRGEGGRGPWDGRSPERLTLYHPDFGYFGVEYSNDVSALIPDRSPPLESHEIIDWANRTFPRSTSRDAIVEYLASMLIEHYQRAWTLSSRAERLLLHRFAYHHVPNLDSAYPVRTLVRRGLVVLDPYPRIMNRSFAQFVRHAERQATIDQWRRGAEHGAWSVLKMPVLLAAPVAIAVLVYFSLRDGSFASLLPLAAAAGLALIQSLGIGRRTVTA